MRGLLPEEVVVEAVVGIKGYSLSEIPAIGNPESFAVCERKRLPVGEQWCTVVLEKQRLMLVCQIVLEPRVWLEPKWQ